MSDTTKNKPLIQGFQNPHHAFYLQQTYKLNWKSELKLEIFGSIFFCPKAGAGAFQLQFFVSELELELLGSTSFLSELELELKALGVKLELAPNWSQLSISVI